MAPKAPYPIDPRAARASTEDAVVAATSAAERHLVAAILRKDRKAAAELVSRYSDAVYGYVRHRLTPRLEFVDDIVQDVFVASLANLSSFRGASSLRAWLLGIARHKVEDFYRRQLREADPLAEPGDPNEPADEEATIEERIDRARALARTQKILRRLPKAYSVALLWRYWENRSAREIAQATDKTEKAVERLLARARTRFHELWDEVGDG